MSTADTETQIREALEQFLRNLGGENFHLAFTEFQQLLLQLGYFVNPTFAVSLTATTGTNRSAEVRTANAGLFLEQSSQAIGFDEFPTVSIGVEVGLEYGPIDLVTTIALTSERSVEVLIGGGVSNDGPLQFSGTLAADTCSPSAPMAQN